MKMHTQASQRPRPRARVLIVDDSTDALRLVAYVLQEMNCSVEFCFDGEDAIPKIANGNYDLLILDWMMPRLDGRETLVMSDRILRRSLSRGTSLGDPIPVLIYTSLEPQEVDIPSCERLDVLGLLSKSNGIPYLMKVLSGTLDTVGGV